MKRKKDDALLITDRSTKKTWRPAAAFGPDEEAAQPVLYKRRFRQGGPSDLEEG
jgi:hypothetical protein